MKKKMIVAAAVAALFTACASTQKATSPDALVGEWTIERIHGTAIDKKAGETSVYMATLAATGSAVAGMYRPEHSIPN